MATYVRLFKKDDPTFEHSSLDRVKRWRCYVAAYMAVEPTEGVQSSIVAIPYLKNRFTKGDELSEDERFELSKHSDKITVSISPAAYTMKFIATEPFGVGGVQYFVQSNKTRAGVTDQSLTTFEDHKVLKESKRDRAQEILIRNNNWMKDVSRDDVDARKAAFKKHLDEPQAVEQNDDDDVQMADS